MCLRLVAVGVHVYQILSKCCSVMSLWSHTGICLLVYWSRWVHISRADNPQPRTRESSTAVATASVTCVMAPPCGCWWAISPSSSWTAFSATGFLFRFFTRPSSTDMRYWERSSSLTSEANPGAESVRQWEDHRVVSFLCKALSMCLVESHGVRFWYCTWRCTTLHIRGLPRSTVAPTWWCQHHRQFLRLLGGHS